MSGIQLVQPIVAKTEPGPLMTVVIGIVVVFGVLLLLTFIFWLFGVIAGSGQKKASPAPAPAPKSVAPVSAPPAPKQASPAVAVGVPQEVVAVISAAIASMSDDGVQYVVRRIRPVSASGSRPVWAAAGIADNTRPF